MTTLKKIVIAPDSFKESLSAMDVAKAIEAGFREIYPQAHYVCVPMADGGEGTVEAMVAATGGQIITTPVTAPLGNKVDSFFGLLGDGETAVVEMAAASGLHLVPTAQRDPRITTSYGTGELILAALERGVKAIIIGIGGSATNDGGAGMMQALGARFLDGEGRELAPGGAALARLERLDLSALDPRLAQVSVTAACDVDNPLCGEKGASAVFGPQKGATPEMVSELDTALRRFGEQLEAATGKAIISAPGAGAAGGLGAALPGMLNAELPPGIELVIEYIVFAQPVRRAVPSFSGQGTFAPPRTQR
ncbi:glycerate kinase, partial [Cronobacter sakazakii]|nr:glycerate kinase [Cronobacter sakazakii]